MLSSKREQLLRRVLVTALCAGATRFFFAQTASPATDLQQLTQEQQAAVQSGDTEQILKSSEALAAVTLSLLGDLALQRNNADGAITRYTSSLAESDVSATRLALANAYLLARKPDLALAECDRVIATDPQSADAWRSKGEADLAAKKNTEALHALERSWQVNPTTQTGALLVSAEDAEGRAPEAEQWARQTVTAFGDTPQIHLILANAYHQAGDLDRTIAELNRAVSLDPKQGTLHLALGTAYWELNENQYNPDSLREFTAAQQLSPADYFSNFDLGSVLSQYHRYADATPYLKQAIALNPESPDPWFQLGLNAYAEHRSEEARTDLQKAARLAGAPEDPDAMETFRADMLLSILDAQSGDRQKARAMETSAEQLRVKLMQSGASTPVTESTGLVLNNAPSRQNAAAHPGASDKHADGQGDGEQEKALQSLVAKSLNDAGTALARNHDYQGALPFFRKAAAADPSLSPVLRNLGLAAFHTGDYAEAVTALEKSLAQDGADALASSYLERARAAKAGAPAR